MPKFEYICGTGAVKIKATAIVEGKDDRNVIFDGGMSLPGVGQVYLDGVRLAGQKAAKLEVKRATDRKVIGTLTIPHTTEISREAKLKYRRQGERKAVETTVIATLRFTERKVDGKLVRNWRFALRDKSVMIAPQYA